MLIYLIIFSKLSLIKCSSCQLSICGNDCKNFKNHAKECQLLKNLKLSNSFPKNSTRLSTLSCLTPLKALLLDKVDQEVVTNLKSHRGPQHGREIEFLINEMGMEISEEEKEYLVCVCSVLDANVFEVVIGDGQDQTSLRGK